jgi:hypothetical protein
VSIALTHGVNVTWLSEQTGVAVTTLLKHYGKFIHTPDADRVELSKIERGKGSDCPRFAHEQEAVKVSPRPRSWLKASPTGFEPAIRLRVLVEQAVAMNQPALQPECCASEYAAERCPLIPSIVARIEKRVT